MQSGGERKGCPGSSVLRDLLAKEIQETQSDPWVGKIPWRRKWQPAPVVLPGESHGQRRLLGDSPKGLKESDVTERLTKHTHGS